MVSINILTTVSTRGRTENTGGGRPDSSGGYREIG
jgi:hypothetical protein